MLGVVLQLLGGVSLEELPRELQVEAHRPGPGPGPASSPPNQDIEHQFESES